MPSGDRALGQSLLRALRIAGHETFVASRFRSFDGRGDAMRQQRLQVLGRRLAARLVRRLRHPATRPDLWFTYHLHHKAPDWLGPAVSHALDIPYVVAEASIAAKQSRGVWAVGYAGSVAAIEAAAATIFLNRSISRVYVRFAALRARMSACRLFSIWRRLPSLASASAADVPVRSGRRA